MTDEVVESISRAIEAHFLMYDYQWNIDGELQYPTAADIRKVVALIKETLDKHESDGVQLEIGRLIGRKSQGSIDIYVHFGEI